MCKSGMPGYIGIILIQTVIVSREERCVHEACFCGVSLKLVAHAKSDRDLYKHSKQYFSTQDKCWQGNRKY